MSSDVNDVREEVRRRYGEFARKNAPIADRLARTIGYVEEDLLSAPRGANLGLGCGNPVALASLRPGEVVIDLGSGAGFDAFLAAKAVGPSGHVIGIDMTPDMVEKARRNAAVAEATNVEFRLGTIEALPVEDQSVDVVISNCVINLSPDKPRVFAEAFRTLRSGGRLMISDLVSLGDLPKSVRSSVAAYVGCVAGVSLKNDYLRMLREAGFDRVDVVQEKDALSMLGLGSSERSSCACSDPLLQDAVGDLLKAAPAEDLLRAATLIVSVQIAARKPA